MKRYTLAMERPSKVDCVCTLLNMEYSLNVMSCSLESIFTLLEHSHVLTSGTDSDSIIQSQCKPLKYLGNLINKDHVHGRTWFRRPGGVVAPLLRLHQPLLPNTDLTSKSHEQ